jgi:hypothetical protein
MSSKRGYDETLDTKKNATNEDNKRAFTLARKEENGNGA